jgi:hypothetical protein
MPAQRELSACPREKRLIFRIGSGRQITEITLPGGSARRSRSLTDIEFSQHTGLTLFIVGQYCSVASPVLVSGLSQFVRPLERIVAWRLSALRRFWIGKAPVVHAVESAGFT